MHDDTCGWMILGRDARHQNKHRGPCRYTKQMGMGGRRMGMGGRRISNTPRLHNAAAGRSMPAQTHAPEHTRVQTQAHTGKHTHARTRAHTHTRTHARTHAHTHTHTHTRTSSSSHPWIPSSRPSPTSTPPRTSPQRCDHRSSPFAGLQCLCFSFPP